MTMMLVLFAAMLNAGLSPVHQTVSVGLAPVKIQPVNHPTPVPEALRR